MERVTTTTKPPKTFFEQEIEHINNLYGLPQHHYVAIRQSKAFMEQFYSDKIQLKAMAAAAFMSRFHYIRIFQQVYGMTPGQYLRDLRIKKAKELLKTSRPVTQVCFDVGYESLPTFSNAFRKGTGFSPKAYQAQQLRNLE